MFPLIFFTIDGEDEQSRAGMNVDCLWPVQSEAMLGQCHFNLVAIGR